MEKGFRRNPEGFLKEDRAKCWKRTLLIVAGIALVAAGGIRERSGFNLSEQSG